MGVRATPAPPYIPVLFSRLIFLVVLNPAYPGGRLTLWTDIAFSQVLRYPICDRFRWFLTLTKEFGYGY